MIRKILVVILLGVLTVANATADTLGEDGLHKQDWFAITFKDMADDIESAREEGMRLAIIFEQRGCIYCQKMHEQLLSDPEIADYIQANFKVVQYNMFGDEEVVDIDGDVLTEKTAARKWGIVFTPTILFLPETVGSGQDASRAAVAKMPGAFGKWTFLNMFRWVNEKGYEGDEHFQKYHARIINQLREEGRIGVE